ncbi:probable magnesium transporter NIPA7 [Quercus suber]|uniref:probable magnesium transporter NIPA7 n=1 Tax=Quercus suber TaxID=58331 RepID=UPI0032E02BB8
MYSSNLTGFILAMVSSAFIGSSFIIKKKGLRRASANGPRASVGGYGYLLEPLWWVGMITSPFFFAHSGELRTLEYNYFVFGKRFEMIRCNMSFQIQNINITGVVN